MDKRSGASKVGEVRPTEMLAKLKGLASQFVAFVPALVVVAAGLVPLIWLQDGLILKSIDSYFDVYPRHVLATALYTWQSSSSFGGPSFATPSTILLAIQQGLFVLGTPLVVLQGLILCALTMCSVVGATQLMGEVLKWNHRTGTTDLRDKFVCASVGVVWVANPFSLSFVWSHQLQTEVTWAVLPWLVLVAVRGASGALPLRRSLAWVVILSFLGAPGLPHIYVPSVALLLVIMALSVALGRTRPTRDLARVAAVILTFVGILTVWLGPALPILMDLVRAAEVGQPPLAQLRYNSQFTDLANVLSLTALPALHQTVSGTHYMSWWWLVLAGPGRVLRFVLPVVALVGSVWGIRRPQTRRIAVGSTIAVAIGALLSKGINPPFASLDADLLRLPLGAGYTYPLDKFALVLVLPLCLLFGLGLHALTAAKWRGVAVAVAVVVVTCGWLALPWWNGQVIRSAAGLLPSTHVRVPAAYGEVGKLLARLPALGKSFVVPYQPLGTTALSWQHGIQPNLDCLLEDWAPARSVICVNSGQPYGDRIAEALNSGLRNIDPRAFALARLVGVDAWVVHRDWAYNYVLPSVSPITASVLLQAGGSAPSTTNTEGPTESKTSLLSSHSVTITVRLRSIPTTGLIIAGLGTVRIQANPFYVRRAREQPAGYFIGLFQPHLRWWLPIAPAESLSTGVTYSIKLSLSRGRLYPSIQGFAPGPSYRCPKAGTYCHQIAGSNEDGYVPMGIVPPNGVTLSAPNAPNSIATVHILPSKTLPSSPKTTGEDIPKSKLLFSSHYLLVYGQRALPPLYVAKSVYCDPQPLSDGAILAAAQRVATAPEPAVLLGCSLKAKPAFGKGRLLSWHRANPTNLTGTVEGSGHVLLVFSQSYDRDWQLDLNGRAIPSADHRLVNGFANAWLVNLKHGTSHWDLFYTPQALIVPSQVLALALFIVAMSLVTAPLVRLRLGRSGHGELIHVRTSWPSGRSSGRPDQRSRPARRRHTPHSGARTGVVTRRPLSYIDAVGATFSRIRGPLYFMACFAVARVLPGVRSRLALIQTRAGTRLVLPISALTVVVENLLLDVPGLLGDIGPNPVVVDIGAHVGSYTFGILEKYRTGTYLAFEPSPDTYGLLVANIWLNGVTGQVHPFRIALAAQSGIGTFEVRGPASPGNRLVGVGMPVHSRDHGTQVVVTTKSLTDVLGMLQVDADLVKIDCEGGEYDIIETAEVATLRRAKRLFVEYHPSPLGSAGSLADALIRAGFQEIWRMPSRADGLGTMLWRRV